MRRMSGCVVALLAVGLLLSGCREPETAQAEISEGLLFEGDDWVYEDESVFADEPDVPPYDGNEWDEDITMFDDEPGIGLHEEDDWIIGEPEVAEVDEPRVEAYEEELFEPAFTDAGPWGETLGSTAVAADAPLSGDAEAIVEGDTGAEAIVGGPDALDAGPTAVNGDIRLRQAETIADPDSPLLIGGDDVQTAGEELVRGELQAGGSVIIQGDDLAAVGELGDARDAITAGGAGLGVATGPRDPYHPDIALDTESVADDPYADPGIGAGGIALGPGPDGVRDRVPSPYVTTPTVPSPTVPTVSPDDVDLDSLEDDFAFRDDDGYAVDAGDLPPFGFRGEYSSEDQAYNYPETYGDFGFDDTPDYLYTPGIGEEAAGIDDEYESYGTGEPIEGLPDYQTYGIGADVFEEPDPFYYNGDAGLDFDYQDDDFGYGTDLGYDSEFGYDYDMGYGYGYNGGLGYDYGTDLGYDSEFGYDYDMGYGYGYDFYDSPWYGYGYDYDYESAYPYDPFDDGLGYESELGYDYDMGYGYPYEDDFDYGYDFGYDDLGYGDELGYGYSEDYLYDDDFGFD